MSKIFEYLYFNKTRLFAIFGARLNQKCWFYMVLLTFYIIFQEHQECNMQNTPSTINFFHNTTNTTGVLAAHLVLTPFLQLELKNRDQAVLNSKQGHVVTVCQFIIKNVRDWGSLNNCFPSKEHQSHPWKKKRNRCSTRWTAQFLGALRPKCLGKWTAAPSSARSKWRSPSLISASHIFHSSTSQYHETPVCPASGCGCGTCTSTEW